MHIPSHTHTSQCAHPHTHLGDNVTVQSLGWSHGVEKAHFSRRTGCWNECILVRLTIHLLKICNTEMHLLISWNWKSWTQQHKASGLKDARWKKTSTLQGTNSKYTAYIYTYIYMYMYIYIYICILQLAAACGLQETCYKKVSKLQHTADCCNTWDKDHSLQENPHTATHYCLIQPVGSCERLWRKVLFIVLKKGFQNRTKGHSLK